MTHRRPMGTVAYMGGLPAVLEMFAWSWGQMVAFNAEFLEDADSFVHYDRAGVSYHAMARNDLASRFLGDWLLMLDTDHAFEPDLCRRLLHRSDTCGADVVTGTYLFKAPPHSPVVYADLGDGPRPIRDWETEGPQQIAAAGAGCLMVKRRVFDRIRTELKEEPFDIRPGQPGEDLSFFARLSDLRIPVLWDPRIEAPHLRIHPLTLENYPREWRRPEACAGGAE